MKLTGKHKALMAGSRAIAGIAGFVSCCGVTTADRTDTGVATETAPTQTVTKPLIPAEPTDVAAYEPTKADLADWTSQLVDFDTNTQTRADRRESTFS